MSNYRPKGSVRRPDRFDVDVPARCSLHQCVKGRAVGDYSQYRQCILCRYYTKDIDSAVCLPCLNSDDLDNWQIDSFIDEDPRWVYLLAKLGYTSSASSVAEQLQP